MYELLLSAHATERDSLVSCSIAVSTTSPIEPTNNEDLVQVRNRPMISWRERLPRIKYEAILKALPDLQ